MSQMLAGVPIGSYVLIGILYILLQPLSTVIFGALPLTTTDSRTELKS